MTHLIEVYDANKINPWHFWLEDNVPVEYRRFVMKAVTFSKYMDTKGWTLGYVEKALKEVAVSESIDFMTAVDYWIAYEEFKAELAEYRLAKAGA